MGITAKEAILRALNFKGDFTTGIYFKAKEYVDGMGIKSCTNRLQELRAEGKVSSKEVPGHKELYYELVKTYKDGQISLL